MRDITIAITAASYSGNKGAAAMLQSSICQLKDACGERLNVNLMSVYPAEDRVQCPHDFVKIVPATPQEVLFLAFPCAVLYRVFRRCLPLRALLLKNRMLRAYAGTDLVVDEAGIAFSDSRGLIMNLYAFACAAIPLLLGVPLVKYSQALGPFHKISNCLLAKWILPKAQLVIARGRYTYEHLHAIGIRDNVRLCADGAFTMPLDAAVEKRVQKVWDNLFWRADETCGPMEKHTREARGGFSYTVALSISSVVERKCRKAGMDYCGILADFIFYLTAQGCQVYMFANAARAGSQKPRNNDLMTGDAIFQAYRQKADSGLFWDRREMDAEEISARIARCDMLIASRFHAMVFALARQVPVMLVGWSHKYREVMEQFDIEEYATDYKALHIEKLKENYEAFVKNRARIQKKIAENLPAVQESSRQNVRLILQVLEKTRSAKNKKTQMLNHAIDLTNPDAYIGNCFSCMHSYSIRMGYALDAKIRANAASGGMVTALLCNLLKNHEIDGAWVVKTAFTKAGALTYETYIAKTPAQVMEAASSVYLKIPMLSHLDMLRQFDGRLAVVLTPCMLRAFCYILEKEPPLKNKIVLKIGLFCSGVHDKKATEYALDKARVPRTGAVRLYYRTGHWRGRSGVRYGDGSQKNFSYTKTICAYKNAYFFVNKPCLNCRDQFACFADISFGDVWLSEIKKEPIKYTTCVIRTKQAAEFLRRAETQEALYTRHMSATQLLQSQARALTFKYRSRPNHRLAAWLAEKNRRFSIDHPACLKRIPMPLIYYYMCFIRLLLSW